MLVNVSFFLDFNDEQENPQVSVLVMDYTKENKKNDLVWTVPDLCPSIDSSLRKNRVKRT